MNKLGFPWKLDAEAEAGVGGCRTIEDCNGNPIMNTHGLADDEEDRAIAEHVIKSANNHAELVKRLAWAVRFIETYAAEFTGPATPEMNKCRAILKTIGAA